jgi:hypothetical protein
MNTTAKLLCSLTLLTSFLVPARAASPEYINCQGLLNGANGQPLPTGSYTMEFNIYDSATGGAKQWGPFLFDDGAGNGHGPKVPVANGRFNVIIGPLDTNAVSINNAFASVNRFVEIKVNNGSPILPRQQFLSTPYAFKANVADQAASVTDANVAYRNTANTFTGNQTVNGNATFTGAATFTGNITSGNVMTVGGTNLTVGGKGVVVGEGNLRIVRGSVWNSPGGSVLQAPSTGEGFQFQHLNTGFWKVIFNTAFSSVPTVTANVNQESAAYCIVYNVTTNEFSCGVLNPNRIDYPFNFIAVGPR